MQRGEVGRYETTSAGGEQVRAFVPLPLPPDPALAFDGTLQQALEAATLALGRLDAISTLLPEEAIFLYAYVRKEGGLLTWVERPRHEPGRPAYPFFLSGLYRSSASATSSGVASP